MYRCMATMPPFQILQDCQIDIVSAASHGPLYIFPSLPAILVCNVGIKHIRE